MIVVDTQVITYWVLPSSETPLAQRVRGVDVHWVVPALWRSEFRSVLLSYMRNRDRGRDEALRAFRRASSSVRATADDIDTLAFLNRSLGNRTSAYDLEFVVLADSLAVPLVTFDKEVLAAFPGVAVHPQDFVRS